MIGESVVEVRDHSGESIRYQPATAHKLLSYIRSMEPNFAVPVGLGNAPLRFL
ncbi:hypothetical protein [Alterisphingorhabdus coralli]|uniref:hypothetical protein n=1 Tax=Alterisphingorhabdus coralli TaxID=3071408 RepID=UPI0038737E53